MRSDWYLLSCGGPEGVSICIRSSIRSKGILSAGMRLTGILSVVILSTGILLSMGILSTGMRSRGPAVTEDP